MTALVAAWWSWIVPASIALAVLGLALFVAERLGLRRLAPRAAAAIWCLVFLRAWCPAPVGEALASFSARFTPPAASAWLQPLESFGRELAAGARVAEPAPSSARPEHFEIIGTTAARAASSPAARAGRTRPTPVAGALFALWIAGALAMLITGQRRERTRRRALLAGARPWEPDSSGWSSLGALARRLGLRALPTVLVSPDAAGPLVLGAWRPRVILPERFVARVNALQLEHVLLHELAHVARRDPLRSLATRLALSPFWFHPALWYARHRLDEARELGCDRRVARALGDRTPDYRATLIRLAHARFVAPEARPGVVAGLGLLRGRSAVLERIDALAAPRSSAWRAALVWSACGLLFVAGLPRGEAAPGASELVEHARPATGAEAAVAFGPTRAADFGSAVGRGAERDAVDLGSDVARERALPVDRLPESNTAPAFADAHREPRASALGRSAGDLGGRDRSLDPSPIDVPSLDRARGCMQRQLVVLAALAASEQ